MTAKQLFAAGAIVATPGARALGVDLNQYIRRHLSGDFGTVGHYEDLDLTAAEAQDGELVKDDTGKANLYAIRNGGQVRSAYNTLGGRLWVITDGLGAGGTLIAYTATTALTPAEY